MKLCNLGKILIGIFFLIFIIIFIFIMVVLTKYNDSSGDYVLKVEEEKKIDPAGEEEIIAILNIVSDKLRVFDLEVLHPELKKMIEENIEDYKSDEKKKEFIETAILEYFIGWKDKTIRDILIEERGEYTSEDYEYIDERTGISTIVKFAISFELEFFNVK